MITESSQEDAALLQGMLNIVSRFLPLQTELMLQLMSESYCAAHPQTNCN